MLIENNIKARVLKKRNVVNDELVIDLDSNVIVRQNKEYSITNNEKKALQLLISANENTVSKEQLTTVIWEDDAYGKEQSLVMLIRRLRKKIETDPTTPKRLLNIKGIGYKLRR